MPSLLPRSWSDIADLLDEAVELLYPPSCAACDHRPPLTETPLCSSCLATLSPQLEMGHPPRLFLGHHQGPLRTVIGHMKQGRQRRPALFLGFLLGRLVRNVFSDVDGLISVPPSSRRVGRRDFDPARLVAEEVARSSGLPLKEQDLLKKVRATRKQAFLSQEERFTNVAGAFEAAPEVYGRSFVLIDDVLTTGATLTACQQAIEAAGGNIFGAAFLSRRPCFVGSVMSAHGAPFTDQSPESWG